MPILHILLLGFSGAVIAVWFRHHFVMLPDNQLSIGLPFFLASSLVALVLFFCFQYSRKHPSLSFHFRPVFILPVVFLLSATIFNTQAFLRGLIFTDGPLIPLVSWVSANLSFAAKFGSVILTYVFLTIAFFSAGNLLFRTILRHPIQDQHSVYGIALRIIAGMFLWSTLLLGLGMLGGLPDWIIWISFSLLVIWEHRAVTTLFRQMFNVTGKWQPHFRSAEPYLLALGCFLVAFTLTQSLKPHPTGYDDMTHYMDRVHIVSERGEIIAGGRPYPFEILAAAIRIASGNDTLLLAMSLGTYCLFFGTFVLYGFGQAVFSRRTGVLSAIILLSLPIGAALAIREVKPDPLLFAVSAMVLWSLIRSVAEKKLIFWHSALGLFSFAVIIKLTALFLVAPLAITATLIAHQRRAFDITWRSLIMMIIIGLIPLLPWISYGLTTHPVSSAINSFEALISSESTDEYKKLRNEVTTYVWRNSCLATGAAEDFSRFVPARGPIERWLKLPWDTTMNVHIGSFATEIGFLFLALLPWYFAIRQNGTVSPNPPWHERPRPQIALFALGYFLLWAVLGEGVFWYAYPGLSLLILLVVELREKVHFSRILFMYFWIVLALGLIGNTLVQMKLKGERAQVLFAGNELSADEFLDQSIAGYGGAIKILNQDPESRVLLTSSQLWYGIIDNDRRAVMDPYLDTFNCIHRERNDALTLSRLRDFDIRYVLHARGYNTELERGTRPTFNAKIEAFTDFIGHNLRVVWGSPYYTIFEVPPADFHTGR